jgi:hypothetical protein
MFDEIEEINDNDREREGLRQKADLKDSKKEVFKPGQKVTYVTPFKKEHGIVKSISDESNTFVVYKCNNEWHRYFDYTAARTSNDDLKKGWI